MATTSGVTRQDLDDLRDELKADIARVDGKVDSLGERMSDLDASFKLNAADVENKLNEILAKLGD